MVLEGDLHRAGVGGRLGSHQADAGGHVLAVPGSRVAQGPSDGLLCEGLPERAAGDAPEDGLHAGQVRTDHGVEARDGERSDAGVVLRLGLGEQRGAGLVA